MSDFPIPEAALVHHLAILGKTGAGKTSTEKLIVEHVVEEGFRVCILDAIKSDWWGVTSSADGRRPGLPFKILGGPRGHVPLHSSAGAAIGRLVGSGQLPLSIIDMADFEAGGLQRFFVDFAEALMRSARGVLYLVIEEAHEFAPKERAGIGAESMAIHWAKKLATAGRSKGIRLIVATQRVQALHNAVLGSCETMVTHRLTAPADQEPVLKWLKANADKATLDAVSSTLSSLPTGTGWVCSGEARVFEQVAFPKFATFDNTATPTGDGDEVAVETAAVDQDELRAIIGDAVAEAEANDPKALKAKIALLERKLRDGPQLSRNPGELAEAEERGYRRGLDVGERIGTKAAVTNIAETLRKLAAETLASAEEIEAPPATPIAPSEQTPKINMAPPAQRAPRPAPAPSSELGAKANVLKALAWWKAAGFDVIDRRRACIIAGYSPKASTFGVYISQLARDGLVATPEPGKISLTPDGAAAAPPPDMPGTLVDAARALLSQAEAKIFDIVVGAFPEALSRADVADAAGLSRTASTVGVYISKVGSYGFIESGRGTVRAADWLFEGGRS